MKDYYKILGIKPSATPTEIKKAYRQLAMQYHPDKNPDPYAEAQFKEVQEAYSTLSNPVLRERYDDECWLSGMSKKSQYAQAVTPSWLLTVAKDLNKSLAQMDTHRMSHNALQQYILLILTDAHIGVLKQNNDTEKNTAIIAEIIMASSLLHIRYIPEITDKLQALAGADSVESKSVAAFRAARERQAFTQKMYPYIVLLVTLALCVFMYLYAEKS